MACIIDFFENLRLPPEQRKVLQYLDLISNGAIATQVPALM